MRAAAVLCLLACFAAVSAVEIPFHRDPAKKTVPSFTVHEDGRITHLPFSEEYFKQGSSRHHHSPAHSLRRLTPKKSDASMHALSVIVLVKGDADANGIEETLKAKSLDSALPNFHASVTRTYTLTLNGFAATLSGEAINYLSELPEVAVIEHDRRATALGRPTHHMPGYRTRAGAVAAAATARRLQTSVPNSVDRLDGAVDGSYTPIFAEKTFQDLGTVFVIDTGLRADHVEFAGETEVRIRQGYDFVDDDDNPDECFDSTTNAYRSSHGTHCAGTVAGDEIAGVNKGLNLVALRVLDCSGSGSFANILAAMEWLGEKCGTPGYPAPCTASMSLGGDLAPGQVDTASAEAIEALFNQGITTVVAAGNSARDACNTTPAQAPLAVTVGAVSLQGEQGLAPAVFTNFGACVDIMAPGVDVISATSESTTSYADWSGTSMATPAVAAVLNTIMADADLQAANGNALSPATAVQTLLCLAERNVVSGDLQGSPNRFLHIPRESFCVSGCGCGPCDDTKDGDNDGHNDCVDNCFFNANPDQLDTDEDGMGDECDPDDDNDGVPDALDDFPKDPTRSCAEDRDEDGICDSRDSCVSMPIILTATNPSQDINDGSADGPYTNNIDCTTQITVPPGHNIEVVFHSFDTETNFDFVRFIDDATPPNVLVYHGSLGPFSFVLRAESAVLAWTTDGSVVREGWSASVHMVQAAPCTGDRDEDGVCDDVDPCIESVTLQAGEVYHYTDGQGLYSNNENCATTFYLPSSPVGLDVTINSFNLETGYDYLNVFDGSSTASPHIVTLNGVSPPSTTLMKLRTSEPVVTMLFTSDGSVVREGFDISVSEASGDCPRPDGDQYWCFGNPFEGGQDSSEGDNSEGPGSDDDGTPPAPPACHHIVHINDFSVVEIISDGEGQYDNNELCLWEFYGAAGSFVEINFDFINLEERWDYLYFSSSPTSGFDAAFSGNAVDVKYSSPTSYLAVMFDTDGSVVREGFEGFVQIVSNRCADVSEQGWCGEADDGTDGSSDDGFPPLDCSFDIHLSAGDSAMSSDGPGPYVNSHSCMQRFTAPPGMHLRMEFAAFALEHHFDRLHVYSDADTVPLVLTGGLEPSQHTLVSSGNSLNVYFTSDVSIVNEGWMATVTVTDAPCEDANNDGFCGGEPVDEDDYGCTDPQACNFNPMAVFDDNTCFYSGMFRDCYGRCLFDVNRNYICDQMDPYVQTSCRNFGYDGLVNVEGTVYSTFCPMSATSMYCPPPDNRINGLPLWRASSAGDSMHQCGYSSCPAAGCDWFGSSSGSSGSSDPRMPM